MEHDHKDMKHKEMEGIQIMKSTFNLVSVCAILMFFLSNVAFATILTSSSYTPRASGNAYCYGGGNSGTVTASANHNYSSGSASVEGEYYIYTTEPHICSWSVHQYVFAWAHVSRVGGETPTASASAESSASFGTEIGGSVDQDSTVNPYSNSHSDGGTCAFPAGYGISCSYDIHAEAHVAAGGSSAADGYATGTSEGTLTLQ